MKRIFALVLSFAVLFSCLVLPAGAMFDPTPVYQVQAQSAYIVNTDTNIIPCSISSADGYNNYQPTPASGDEASRIKSKIEECSAAIPAADSSSATSEDSDSEE